VGWSGRATDPTKPQAQNGIEHIGEAQWADALVVAPATANILAKFAHGIADDFLTTCTWPPPRRCWWLPP
jgi:phosphopantothenoylcysteine synthetase/decarboxylase